MSKISVNKAAKIIGKHPETIYKALRSGKLSFTLNGNNRKEIDVAELERVYPFVKTIEEIEQETEVDNFRQPLSQPDTNVEIAALKEKITNSENERNREREQLQAHIDYLEDALERSQEGHNRATLLLENHSGGGDLEKSLKSLESRIVNQEQSSKERKLKSREKINKILQQNKALQEALEKEENKNFWQKLFG